MFLRSIFTSLEQKLRLSSMHFIMPLNQKILNENLKIIANLNGSSNFASNKQTKVGNNFLFAITNISIVYLNKNLYPKTWKINLHLCLGLDLQATFSISFSG